MPKIIQYTETSNLHFLKSSKYAAVFLVLFIVRSNRWENRAMGNMDGPIPIVRLEACM